MTDHKPSLIHTRKSWIKAINASNKLASAVQAYVEGLEVQALKEATAAVSAPQNLNFAYAA